MIAADRDFLAEFTLLPAAMDAQKARTRSLIEARHFLILVDSIKRRSPTGIINVALKNPRAMRHLTMPIAVRIKKLREAIFPSQLPSQVKRQTS